MNRPSRFLLVFAAAAGLPLLGGIAPGLPVVGARPVLAAAQEVSAPEAASTSRLVPAITLPAGAMRLNDAGALGELKTQLTTVAKEGGFGISKIEALIWGGNGHDAARNKSVQNALKQAFTKAGYRHETVGEKKTDDGVVTIFLAGKESTKQAVLGFFVASDNYLVLAWGQMTPQQNGAKNADEEPAAAAKPGNSAANTTKRPASAEQKRLDAELLAAISEDNVDAVKTLLKQGADPNGRTGEFRHAILMPAVRRGNKDVVAALLRAGADPDYGDGTNVTPLYIAAVLGEPRRFRRSWTAAPR
jgi:hypothetical protein